MSKPVIPRRRLEELYANTSKENPKSEDVIAFREALEKMPELVELTGNLANRCQQAILDSVKMLPSARLIYEAGVNNLRKSLGYDSAPDLEKLLIEQVVLCHLRLYVWEYLYHTIAGQSLDQDQLQKWEGLVSMAQRRYFRAIETLHRTRRLGIQIQVNIATEGGQQVNVGNVETTQVGK